MRIRLSKMFNTDTLRDRQSAMLVVERVSKLDRSASIVIDFSDIVFVSRSFCHELLSCLQSRGNIRFENVNKEIQEMMLASLEKPNNHLDYPMKKLVVC